MVSFGVHCLSPAKITRVKVPSTALETEGGLGSIHTVIRCPPGSVTWPVQLLHAHIGFLQSI